VIHVGKESTLLDREALEGAWRRVKVFHEPEPDEWEEVLLPLLLETPTAEITRRLGVDRSTVKRWKTGVMRPHPRRRASLAAVVTQGR